MEPFVTTIITALISSVVGAVVGALVSRMKTAARAVSDAKNERAELKGIMEQNIVMTCRMAIYDEHFTVDEKLDAYKIYRDYGGNHTTKKFMDELVGCDVDEYLERHGKD